MIESMFDWWQALSLVPQVLLLLLGFVIAVLLIDRILLWASSGVRSCLHDPDVSLHRRRDG